MFSFGHCKSYNQSHIRLCASKIDLILSFSTMCSPFQNKAFGEAGSTIIVEEKLEGNEISVSLCCSSMLLQCFDRTKSQK